MLSLTIRKAGLLTTIQDLGRFGYGRFGVPQAGAMDPLAFRVANRLVGNPENTSALEMTGIGPEIVFHQETGIALAGGNLTPTLDGQVLAMWHSHLVKPDQVLGFGARRQGARCYLAVTGGLVVPAIMGSAATDLDSGFGGLDGRPLRAGQILQIGPHTLRPLRKVRLDFLAAYSAPFEIRFVAESDGVLGDEIAALFESSRYRVSKRSDRMGYRLEGTRVPVPAAGDMISEAIPPEIGRAHV